MTVPTMPPTATPAGGGGTTINFQQLYQNTGEIEAVPASEYDVLVEEVDVVETKTTGLPMLKLKLRIQGGPQNNRVLFDNINITHTDPSKAEAVQRFFFRKMAALGLGYDGYLIHNPSLEQIAQDLVGKTSHVKTKTREWNGATQTDVSAYMGPARGVGGPAGLAGPAAGPAAGAVPGAAPAAPGFTAPIPAPVTGPPAAAPTAAPVAPPVAAPAPAPASAAVAPVPTPAVVPQAAPAAPAPAPTPAPAAAPAATLPPGMDQAQYEAFLAFQQSQVAAAAAPAGPAPVPVPVGETPAAPPMTPTAAPAPEPPAATFI